MNFIQLLELEVAQPLISTNLLQIYSNRVVDDVMDYARRLVGSPQSTPSCRQTPLNYRRTSVDLTVIIDGSRNAYENLQLIHAIADIIDVSHFGSYISVIHGTSGRYLVNRTNSLPNLYEQLLNSSSVSSESHDTAEKRSIHLTTIYSSLFSFFLQQKIQIPYVCHFQIHMAA